MGLEDYFQVGVFSGLVGRGRWDRFERRIEVATHRTLDLLDEHSARATFFVVGWMAERLPELVREVATRGHEVANQGYSHRTIAEMASPEAFRDDLQRSREALERATGRTVVGHRVPHFLGPHTLWALDVLALEGMAYDSSLRPVLGRFSDQRFIHRHRAGGRSLIEVPVSTLEIMGAALPLLAGNALRQLPRPVVQRAVNAWFQETDQPLVTYFHTWELDPDQPRISGISRLTQLRHYRNLDQEAARLGDFLLGPHCMPIADYLGVERPDVSFAAEAPLENMLPIEPSGPVAPRPAVSIVIPCYNEAETVPYLQRTLAGLRRALVLHYEPHFVFVDDGSTDDTIEMLRDAFGDQPGHRVLGLGKNQGVAAAIMAGIRDADTEIVCSMDCDCSYDPMELLQMIPRLTDGVSLVTASPYHPRGAAKHVPGWRLGLSRGASRLYRTVLGSDLHTYTSCFRVYRKSRVAGLELDQSGFLGVAELLGRLLLRGDVIVEHPCTLESRLFGESKMKTMATIRGHLRLLSELGRARMSGGVPDPAPAERCDSELG